MKLVLLFGAQAVGKMNAGQELEKITKEFYIKINNTHLDAAEVASVIKAEFLL